MEPVLSPQDFKEESSISSFENMIIGFALDCAKIICYVLFFFL